MIIKLHIGGQGLSNFIDHYVDFSGQGLDDVMFNRSDPRIFTDAARGALYLPSRPYAFHISELQYDVINSYFHSEYQNRVFARVMPDYSSDEYSLFQIGIYRNTMLGDELIELLKWINY